jgi:hypothetical protein
MSKPMTVKRLIAELQKLPPELPVKVSIRNNDGCESCGYGETYSECDVVNVNNLETRIVLDWE